MPLSEKLCQILQTGARKESDAHDFYLRAADGTDHPLGKRMFERLADEEAKHEQLLQSWADHGACPADAGFPETDPDILKRAQARIDRVVKPGAADVEAIQIGQEMERKAIAFYQEGADAAEDGESRKLLLRLKAEEDKHLALLADLYEYMRNPNLWSIADEHHHFDA